MPRAAWILVLALTLWAGAVTLLFGDPGAMAAGPLGDGSTLERLWNYWHCSRNPSLRTILEGYPAFGNTLDFWVLGWPLERLAPFPRWFNLQAPLIVLLNGLAGAWAAGRVVGHRPAALAGGLFFGLNPWTLALLREGYIREAFIVFPALLAGTLYGLVQAPRLRDAALAGLWLGLTGAFYWFYGLFAALLVGLAWLGSRVLQAVPSEAPRPRPLPLAWLALLVLVAVLVALPFAVPFMDRLRPDQEVTWGVALPTPVELRRLAPGDQAAWHGVSSGSLHNLFSHSLLPDWPADLSRRGGQPFWLLALALAGVVLRPRQSWLWAASGLGFYLLSLGPYARTSAGYLPSEAAPWGLPFGFFFAWVPLFSRLFHPDRCALFAVLALAVLGAVALEALGERRPGSRGLVAGLAGVAWLGTLLLLPGRPPEVWDVPAFYLRASGTLVEAPVRHRMDLLREGPGIYQVFHGQRVLTWDEPQGAREDPLFLWLARPEGPPPSADGLRRLGVRHLVLHEAGCYGLAADGAALYETLRDDLARALGTPPQEVRETPPPTVQPRTPPGARRFRMSVFTL